MIGYGWMRACLVLLWSVQVHSADDPSNMLINKLSQELGEEAEETEDTFQHLRSSLVAPTLGPSPIPTTSEPPLSMNPSLASVLSNTPTLYPTSQRPLDASTLDGKIMVGYQGWFMTPKDGGINQWKHWSRNNQVPSETEAKFDLWPDLREFDDSELQPTKFVYSNLKPAGLYSSYNERTVERHLRWMREYGIDGAFVQRFLIEVASMRSVRDKVLQNVRIGAEQHGRLFANMYDISNYDKPTLILDIKLDWMHLVDNQHITNSPNYIYHDGLPVVSIWGFGLANRPGTPADALELIRWFKSPLTPKKYRATLMGGVGSSWREKDEWNEVYKAFDIISPWTVGRMKNLNDVTNHRLNSWGPDILFCKLFGIDYMPVVFPGYSFHNSKPEKTFNEIPRLGGNFFWKQMRLAIDAGAKMVYVAMFDEVDEGTAVYKIAENSNQVPNSGNFVRMNSDKNLGYPCVPSYWYMSLIGNATKYLKEGKPMPMNMPPLPTQCPSDDIMTPSFTDYLLVLLRQWLSNVTNTIGALSIFNL